MYLKCLFYIYDKYRIHQSYLAIRGTVHALYAYIFLFCIISYGFEWRRGPEWCKCFDTRVLNVAIETCNVICRTSLRQLTTTLRWTVTHKHSSSLNMTSYSLTNVTTPIPRVVIQQLTTTSHWTQKHKDSTINMTSYGRQFDHSHVYNVCRIALNTLNQLPAVHDYC